MNIDIPVMMLSLVYFIGFIMPMSLRILTILRFYIAMWTIVKVKYKTP